MNTIRKEWEKNGRVSCEMKNETLSSMAKKLQIMATLPKLAYFITNKYTPLNTSSSIKRHPVRILMPLTTIKNEQQATRIVRKFIMLMAVLPINQITAIRNDKKMPKDCLDFQKVFDALSAKQIIYGKDK